MYKRSLPKIKRTVSRDEQLLNRLLSESGLGSVLMQDVRRSLFDPWVRKSLAMGRSAGTINHYLKVLRQIMRLAATEWEDSQGRKWLDTIVPIALLEDKPEDKRQPYPLSWDEQEQLFGLLPDHLREMALFAVNTGCRDAEIYNLRWEWEVVVDELHTSVFVIPAELVKNGRKRLVVLNSIAYEVIERQRGVHNEYVFTFNGKCVNRMNNSAWIRARETAGLDSVRVHDLKHTYGVRLEHCAVHPDLQATLMGHTGGRSMTSHYSPQSLQRLISASESVVSLAAADDREAVVIRI